MVSGEEVAMKMSLVKWPASMMLAATLACTSNTPDNGNQPPPGTVTPGATINPTPVGGAGGTAAPPAMMAGTAAPPPAMMAGTSGGGTGGTTAEPTDAGTMEPEPMEGEDPRGKCNINSGYPGDETCLLPPDPSEGFQIHVGPDDYADPAKVAPFVFKPGQESSQCWSFHTPNTEDSYYQGWVLSGRPGTHHIINTMYATEFADGTTFTVCRDPGTGSAPDIIDNLPGASKAYMPREKVAPENANLGRMIPANTPSQADMHYFNFTQEDILREFWMNIYYIPKEQVTDEARQIRGMGGVGWAITPGTDHVFQYSAEITSPGRIVQLLGHYHAHGKRFTAWVKRASGERTKVFEMYDYLDPQIFNYNSVTQNPDFSAAAAGATSGILEVAAGDLLQWECHIINDSQVTLTYSNEVETGEMCNLWGASVGPVINKVLIFETPF
jgi:hypothetical protein